MRWKPRTIALTFAKGADAGLREDADAVYGESGSAGRRRRNGNASHVAPARLEGEIRSALTKASAHRALSDEEALALFRAEGDALDALCRVADDLRAEAVGDDVTYVINRNINFTNVCYVGCRFCAFAQREVDEESYTLTLAEVADRARGSMGPRRHRGLHAGRHPSRPPRLLLLSTSSMP